MNSATYNHTPSSMATIAWTGGSHPAPLNEVHPTELALVTALVQSQVASFEAFWGRAPDAGTKAMYLERARYDAHATKRAGINNTVIFGG